MTERPPALPPAQHRRSLRGVLLRASIFFTLLVGGTLLWELHDDAQRERGAGIVKSVRRVGGRGDGKSFEVRYETSDGPRTLSTARSLFDQFGALADLDVGDEVPVAWRRDAVEDARLDTSGSRHLWSVMFGALGVLLSASIGIVLWRLGRADPSAS